MRVWWGWEGKGISSPEWRGPVGCGVFRALWLPPRCGRNLAVSFQTGLLARVFRQGGAFGQTPLSAAGSAGLRWAREGMLDGDVLVCPFPPGQPSSSLCLASSSLILWVRRPVLPRCGQTATGKHPSWPSAFPIQPQWKERSRHLHFKTCISPHLPLIRANYTSAPNCRLPGCRWTFILFGVGRNCSLKCHI